MEDVAIGAIGVAGINLGDKFVNVVGAADTPLQPAAERRFAIGLAPRAAASQG